MKEGEEEMERDETVESRRRETFVQFTIDPSSVSLHIKQEEGREDSPRETALTLPLIVITEFLTL